MGQKNSSVVREVSMELQEDVEEVRTLQKGENFSFPLSFRQTNNVYLFFRQKAICPEY
jgi:hypothetical protein